MKFELRGITKAFGPLVANDHIDLIVEPGRIHALLGENGAGRSTLMNVLYGLHQSDVGEILIDDEPVTFSGPSDAVAAGIGMVHQHFMLMSVFIVAESTALGYEPVGSLGLLNTGAAAAKVTEISRRFGFDVDPHALIEDLPIGVQQRVETIKALVRDAKVLILDEPIAVLTPQETNELITIMCELRTSSISIVPITHKLREIREVADTITVIRQGRIVGTAEPTVSAAKLTGLMVGHDASLTVDKPPADPGDDGLALEGISFIEDGTALLEDIDLHVRTGGILATTGVQGNSQIELSEVILGLRPPTTGSVAFDDQDVIHHTVRRRLRAGLGSVPKGRITDGMVAKLFIAESMVLNRYDDPSLGRGPSLSLTRVCHAAHRMCEEFDVRVIDVDDAISTFLGGNQQEAILARELSRPLKVLAASQPTRGLDVGSIELVYQHIAAERDTGTIVLIISSELDEIYALADRIAVMYRGRIVGTVPTDTARDALGFMMADTPAEQALDLQEQTR